GRSSPSASRATAGCSPRAESTVPSASGTSQRSSTPILEVAKGRGEKNAAGDDHFPLPWGPEDRPDVPDFEIQQEIEARSRAVLREVLRPLPPCPRTPGTARGTR